MKHELFVTYYDNYVKFSKSIDFMPKQIELVEPSIHVILNLKMIR